MVNGSCSSCAADGFSVVDSRCIVCDPTCLQCTGTGAKQCTACYSGAYLYSKNGQCLISCPAGYWKDTLLNTCQQCYNSNSSSSSFSCETCSGNSSNECLSCQTGTFLYPNTGGQCLANCPKGYWQDDTTKTCSQCFNPKTDPSSCPSQTPSIVTAVLSPVSSTLPAIFETTMSAFKQSDTISGRMLNLFLCLSAIESIANMQYLNINHSQMALGAYYGLSSAKGTN